MAPLSKRTVIFLLVALFAGFFIIDPLLAQGVCSIVRRDFGVGTSPSSVVVGDFNRDGIADLAVANAGSNNVSILLGNGDGTFRAAQNFPVGVNPSGIAVGDFNGDRIQDLAVANQVSFTGTVSILIGNGDGTFRPAVNFGPIDNPISIAIGDFNLDGRPDLAVARNGGAINNVVAVLLGNGDGTFGAPQTFGSGYVDLWSSSVAVGDFNGDGKPDLAVTSRNSGGSVAILLGNGAATPLFQPAVPGTINN